MLKAYFTDRNVRRLFVLALFVGLLVYFRALFLLFAFFVVFERTIGMLAQKLHDRSHLRFRWCVLIVVGVFAAVLGVLMYEGIEAAIHRMPRIRHSVDAIVTAVRASPLYEKYRHGFAGISPEEVLRQAREHAGAAMHAAEEVGRSILYITIALVFSVVFLFERDELEHWRESMDMDSVPRILLRFLGHAADAIAITLKLQVIVACVNTALTLPVLLALRLPGIPALVAMMFVTGLIPVVGGPIAGVVLMTLSFLTRGPIGLAVFLVSTFILHKIESYYLNPRLTAKHVKLPSFAIIVSLVLFEHAFGLVGVFLSFPCLYVAAKIREGWVDPEYELRDEQEAMRAMRGIVPKMKGFRLRPIPELQPGVEAEPTEPPDTAEPPPETPPPPAAE
jgi:predicted PurR-regulated permease PerM